MNMKENLKLGFAMATAVAFTTFAAYKNAQGKALVEFQPNSELVKPAHPAKAKDSIDYPGFRKITFEPVK